MLLIKLFWSFLQIGFTSFGGLSMVPLISSEMIGHGWMTAQEVSDIVAIAEMTPGPLGLNCATFTGFRTAGVMGAVMANWGILMPTFTITLAAAVCFERFKNGKKVRQMLTGIRPTCVGLIAAVIVTLCATNYSAAGGVSWAAIAIGVVDTVLLLKWNWSVPKVILLSGAAGLFLA